MEREHLAARILEKEEIRVAGRENGLRAVLDREPVVGRHQGLEAGLVSDEFRTLLGLLAANPVDLGEYAGLRKQSGGKICPHLILHAGLNENEHRRRQQEHDCQHGDEQLRPQMFEWPR